MITEPTTEPLTTQSFYDWVTDEENSGTYGSVYEIEVKSLKTPWGTGGVVPGSGYSGGDQHPMGFVFELAGRFFHFSGIYSSWDGSEYDKCEEVYPQEIASVVFNTKDGKRLAEPVIPSE